MRHPSSPRLLAVGLVAATLLAAPAQADETVTGAITGYECGDNCYLTIKTEAGEDLTGLCVAELCQPWNEIVTLPEELMGAAVEIVVGEGKQLDAEGNDMGPFPAFLEITVLN